MIRPVRFLSALLLSLCALNACRADVFTFSFAGDPAYNNYFNPYGNTPPVGYDPVAVTSFNFTMTTPDGAPPDYVDTYTAAISASASSPVTFRCNNRTAPLLWAVVTSPITASTSLSSGRSIS